MESPGEYLKRERELRRASLTSIFEATRVPLKYLEALEADDYESLPHPTFVKGFIRAYCKNLGLDETDAVLRYEIYMKERSDKAEPSRSTLTINRKEPKEGRVFNNSRAIAAVAVGALVVIISYSLYSRHKARIARLNEAAGQASQAAVTQPVPAAAQPVSPEAGQDKVNAAPKDAPKAPPAAEASDSADSADDTHTLVVSANEVVWIKVKIDGGEPFDVVLKKGESVVWKATDSFSLVVGNAGGVSLVYDGEKLSSLGKSGEVVTLKLPRA